MANYKTVPNQKVVMVDKEKCDKNNLYATINLEAMEEAARTLKAGAFKLWVYFAKNQNGYEFALSNKEVLDTFGIKKDQYDTAVAELIKEGYLVETSSNHFLFCEVVGKNHNGRNSVVGKNHNSVVGKNHNQLQEKTTTPCSKNPQEILQDNIYNTIDNNSVELQPLATNSTYAEAAGDIEVNGQKAQVMDRTAAMSKYGLEACTNRVAAGVTNCYWIAGELVYLRK